MTTAEEVYKTLLHRVRHQKTSTITPNEFNEIAKKAFYNWLEEARMYYDKHQKILEAASSLVKSESIAAVNNIVVVPNKIVDFEKAYILSVFFETTHCNGTVVGKENRRNKKINRYMHSIWEIYYDIEEDKIVPTLLPTVDVLSATIVVLHFPNIPEVDAAGASVVDPNLPPQIINSLIDLMAKVFFEQSESIRQQTYK